MEGVPVIVTEQLNSPTLLTVPPQLVTVAPEVISVVMVTPAVNPVPVTMTDTPLGPWSGESAIDWLLIVNPAVALSKAPSEPVTVSVYGTDETEPAIVTEQVNVPVANTVAAQLVTEAPEAMLVAMVAPGVNPLPEMLTASPLGPAPGASVMAGVVRVKDAVAWSNAPSEPVAVTAYAVAEAVPVIVTEQVNAPVPETIAPHIEIAAPAPTVVVTVALGVNPLPETATDTPLGPCVGWRVIAGEVTVNAVLA